MYADKRTTQEALIDRLDQAALLIDGEQVVFANEGALNMLGRYIIGANLRLALRAPSAISAVLAPQDSRALVPSLGTPDSVWELHSQLLEDNLRLVTMQDVSAQRSIARIHADFVANASHELRTPVANILGYVELLKEPKAGNDEQLRSRFLDTIEREGKRMQSVISDLMSLSRIEAVKNSFPEEKIDLKNICDATVEEFSDSGRVKLSLPDQKAEIFGDEAHLKQMLRNLIDNALKYGFDDSNVTVSLTLATNGWAQLSVEDKGIGIPAEYLPRLTERFYRTDPGRSKEAGGTGLGLSIVKHIVIRHRGRFSIESKQGEGTNMSVKLPLTAT